MKAILSYLSDFFAQVKKIERIGIIMCFFIIHVFPLSVYLFDLWPGFVLWLNQAHFGYGEPYCMIITELGIVE